MTLVGLIVSMLASSPVLEPMIPDRLEAAGYAIEVDSLLDALFDDGAWLCHDAAIHLREMAEDGACDRIEDALRQRLKHDWFTCVHPILRLQIQVCGGVSPVYQEVFRVTKERFYDEGPRVRRGYPETVLFLLHDELGFDIFEEALAMALESDIWLWGNRAFLVLLDSYCERLPQSVVDEVWASYPVPESPEEWILQNRRDRIEQRIADRTFPCSEDDEDDEVLP